MFNEKDVNLYKSITAPDELKDKVLSVQKKNIHPYRKVAALAASIVLVLSLAAVWDWNRSFVDVQVEPQQISLMAQDSRELSKTTILLDLSTSRKKKVTVSQGTLTDEKSKSSTEVWISKDTKLRWEIEGNVGEDCKLSISGWGKDQTFQLIFDQEMQTWKLKEQ